MSRAKRAAGLCPQGRRPPAVQASPGPAYLVAGVLGAVLQRALQVLPLPRRPLQLLVRLPQHGLQLLHLRNFK